MRHASYEIVEDRPGILIIRDIGPWDRHPTVTNDAEHVVSELAPVLNGRRLCYYDTDDELDELLVQDGRFSGFSFGPPLL